LKVNREIAYADLAWQGLSLRGRRRRQKEFSWLSHLERTRLEVCPSPVRIAARTGLSPRKVPSTGCCACLDVTPTAACYVARVSTPRAYSQP